MAIMKILAIKDKKIGFDVPFTMPNEGAAIRSFGEACKNKESNLAKYPEDFELFSIGEFDTATGEIKPNEIKLICTAEQFKEQETK